MSRTGISFQDVANAAAKIQGSNKSPTVDNVRECLGTGSKSTIARHLKNWKAGNGTLASVKGVPPELAALITGLWERLQGEANQQISEYRQKANQDIEKAETDFIQSQKKNVELQTTIHQLEEALYKEKDTNKTLEQDLAEERLISSKQQGQIITLEDHLHTQKQENTKLHSLLKNIQNNLEHYQASMQALQQEQAITLEKQKHQFEHELLGLRHQLSENVNESNHLKLQIEQLKLQTLTLEQLKKNHQALEETLKKKQDQLVTLEEKYKENIRQKESVTQTLEKKIKALIDAEQKNAIASSRLNDLEKALQRAEDKMITLRDDQLFLAQEKAHLEGQIKQLKVSIV